MDDRLFLPGFNSVRAEARAALLSLGFVSLSLRRQGPRDLEYGYLSPRQDQHVIVRIHEDSRLIRHPITQQIGCIRQPGWIIVDIDLIERDFRLWKDLRSGPAARLRRMREP